MKKSIFRLSVILLCALCALLLCACGDDLTVPKQPDDGQTSGGDGDKTPATTPASELIFTLNEGGQSYTVTGLSYEVLRDESRTELTIPATYQGLPVTGIGDYALSCCTGLTSITIPGSVTSIGRGAFDGCESLTSITIPNSVVSIGESAFSRCRGLTSITYAGIKAGWIAVEKEDNWKGYDTPADSDTVHCTDGDYFEASLVFTIEGNTITGLTFHGQEKYTTLNIPASINGVPVTGIGDSAFSRCTGLTSVTIGDGVTSIGEWAFCDCAGLTSVTIPDSVTSIGNLAFSNCTGLTSVTFANTSGWYLAGDSAATGGEPVRVTDPATNATNLTENYVWYYWKRNG